RPAPAHGTGRQDHDARLDGGSRPGAAGSPGRGRAGRDPPRTRRGPGRNQPGRSPPMTTTVTRHDPPGTLTYQAPDAVERAGRAGRSPRRGLRRVPLGAALALAVIGVVLLWALLPGLFAPHDAYATI